MAKRLPLIVYVSGASGSGKTTLARALAQQMYLPQFSSDALLAGLRFTDHGELDREAAFKTVFVPLLEHLADAGVSCVVDSVLYKNKSEQDIIAKIRDKATIVNVHATANNALDRYFERETSRTDNGVLLSPDELKLRLAKHKDNLINTEAPLELGLPRLDVDSSDGYNPEIANIIASIETIYPRIGNYITK